MDVLSEILALVRINGSVIAEIKCDGDWGLHLGIGETLGSIPFHYIIQGNCWLRGEQTPPVELSGGDLVVAPHWCFHALSSSPDYPLTKITDLIAAGGMPSWTGGTLEKPLLICTGDGGPTTRILSGVFTLEGRGLTMLIEQLPPLFHMRTRQKGLKSQLDTALSFVRQEREKFRPGYVAVAARLMDLLFIQILRAAITLPSVKNGLLAGLSDSHLARALSALHANPGHNWTVAKLASEACLSRTVFAERFRRLVGYTPIQYVNRWRMTIAEDMLIQSNLPIDRIRNQLGFGSSFAFSRAFRAHCGLSPREYRRAH